MSCACAHVPEGPTEGVFSVDASTLTFGRGALREVGALTKGLGARRVALFTDRAVRQLAIFERAHASLVAPGLDVAIYDESRVEPTDASFAHAARFATEGRFDAYVSVGGGSAIDTCKAALLCATYPGDLMTWFNRPVGAGTPVPGPLPPHVACPTTSGTGSELTGIAVCDVLSLHATTGIAGKVKAFRMPGYPDAEPLVPHGISVVTSAPDAFRFTGPAAPARHLESAVLFGADARDDASPGEVLARALERLMRQAGVPHGLGALGYDVADVPALVLGTVVQKRLLDNAPCPVGETHLEAIFRAAVLR